MSLRRPLLLPLTPLYAAVLAAKRLAFRLGLRKQRRLTHPVISIGSVSAGGAGKTPVVMMLAEMLRRRGYAVSILTRGFGRAPKTVERVDAHGDPAWFGDEPVLMAQRSGVPVFVGANRYQAGLLAERSEEEGKIAVHLLDDGFQHRKLARDVDVVLLTVDEVYDSLLPAGNLREPLAMLRRADIIVVREEEVEQLSGFIKKLRKIRQPAVWVIRRSLSLNGMGTRPLAFCGIARPENFIASLSAIGRDPVETVTFPDHHAYSERDINRLTEKARKHGTDSFVTTEKDAVKLTPTMREQLRAAGPLMIARLGVEMVDEQEAMPQLISLCERLDRRTQKR